MSCGLSAVDKILQEANAEHRDSLYEHEVYAILDSFGIHVRPTRLLSLDQAPDFSDISMFGKEFVVLKAVSPILAHKSDVGGVKIVAADPAVVKTAFEQMIAEMPGNFRRLLERGAPRPKGYELLEGKELETKFVADLKGILLCSFVSADQQSLGGELFMGLRWTREFGYIISAGAGGVDTELFARVFKKPYGVVIASTALTEPAEFQEMFSRTVVFQKGTGRTRFQKRLMDDNLVCSLYTAFRNLALHFSETKQELKVLEFEVNPFLITDGIAVAVDGLCKFGKRTLPPIPRPRQKIKKLLEPESIVVYGASAKGMNVGRIILNNILLEGFPADHLFVIKEGLTELDGVKCYASIADVPGTVDLAVLAVAAPQIPDIIDEITALQKVDSLILIPGGMGEKSGGETIEHRIRATVAQSRLTHWQGPLLNGGNCLGIQSRPGKYDTLFIPKSKLPSPRVPVGKVALISQSGAFMITRISNLERLNPVYSVSTGNQIDITIADYLSYCIDDDRVDVIAVYVEGFKDMDGLEFAQLTRQAVALEKDVIFYKAGRTAEGRQATSGHTASIAGDYSVCEAVMINSGVMIAHNFDEFGALIRTAACLRGKKIQGWNLGALSNAGYEAVGIADNVHGDDYAFRFTGLTAITRERIFKSLAKAKIDALVDIHNPLDITPMAGDIIYAEAVQAMLDDADVHSVVVGVVPLSQAVATLAANDRPEMLITHPDSLANRLPLIFENTEKPFVVVIDSGPLFNPMADFIESKNVPTFRSADLAMRILGRWSAAKLHKKG